MSTLAYSANRVATIKDTIPKLLDAHFGATLGREYDCTNIFTALVHYESKFDVNAMSRTNPTNRGTAGYGFLSSSAIQKILISGSALEKDNVYKCLRAIGLTQVLGFYFMKGSSQTGVCELERLRPDLASTLTVAPGADPTVGILGEANISKSLLAGLIILEGKYKTVSSSGGYFTVRGDRYKRLFPSKISASVAAYLGLGKADINGTTPENYVSSIVGGRSYVLANGKNPIKITDSVYNVASANGPGTNGSNKTNIGPPGCQA